MNRTVIIWAVVASLLCASFTSLALFLPSATAEESYSAGANSRLPPKRVVSMALAADEILAGITLNNHYRKQIAGISHHADNPLISNCVGEFSPEIPRHYGSIEEILALEPDLVITAGFSAENTKRFLANTKTEVITLRDPSSFNQIMANILLVGRTIGATERAEQLLAEIKSKLNEIEQTDNLPNRPRVLYYSAGGFTAGKGTLINEMLELAGGINVAAEVELQRFTAISTELAISLMPDVVIIPSWQNTSSSLKQQITSDRRWTVVPAVREQKVYVLPSRILESVSHHAVDALLLLKATIRPPQRN